MSTAWFDLDAVRAYEDRVGTLGTAEARRGFGQELRLSRWIPVWWHHQAALLAPSTQRGYARQVRDRLLPYLGDALVVQLDVAALSLWVDLMRSDGHPAIQIHRARTVLSRCLHHAAQRGLLPQGNFIRLLDPLPRTPVRRPRPLSPEQTEHLRAALLADDGLRGHPRRGLRSATLVSVMAYGGLRPSEAMGAKRHHVDHAAGGIWVTDVMSTEHRIDQTKTGERRFARLPRHAMRDLELWISTGLVQPLGWLFPNRFGEVTPNSYSNWVRSLGPLRAAMLAAHPDWRPEFERFSPGALRHTCASVRLRSGDPIAEVAVDLGHSAETLIRWYAHEVRASRGAPVEPLDQQIGRAREQIGTDFLARRLFHLLDPNSRRRQKRTTPSAGAQLRLVGNRFVWSRQNSGEVQQGDVI
ncbi:tyrosine-type recombinase/integrase [Conexibacter stalactiti]|uniref:Tyrosine-type recombinase/integrase n=1 Tax=Conexibacter stalactiti TaxID=1940611 RepID=A0ABU4HRK7_9ACTN|nr:tyrosine-type recombinase/integrase [Conexibacter stalactiti]MDW5595916.1 tyrosine-type recombinase/integrase [Conexibacter stalactiti]MEC5036558.1 tyrosine-type recombinase/integrase [Conexibacter stalactiti]